MSFSEGRLLEVATKLQVVLPPTPNWYREELLANFETDRNDEAAMDRAETHIITSWQTHYLQMSALSLIEVCDKYDTNVKKGKRPADKKKGLHSVD